jgi:hypothetical protein
MEIFGRSKVLEVNQEEWEWQWELKIIISWGFIVFWKHHDEHLVERGDETVF